MNQQLNQPTPRTFKRYGYIPDLPDFRDFAYPKLTTPPTLAAHDDLRGIHMPPIYDQGQAGSCTGNASTAAIEYCRHKQGLPFLVASRLFPYYNARVIEGDPGQDGGAQIRDVVKCLAQRGTCPETDWPYTMANVIRRPTIKAYADAILHKTLQYVRCSQDAVSIRATINIKKLPVIFGFTVYTSFESDSVAKTGMVPMPDIGEKVLGGHAVLIVGYDDSTQRYIVRNSWGTGWGQQGYFTMPYAYVHNNNLADDFWVLSLEQ